MVSVGDPNMSVALAGAIDECVNMTPETADFYSSLRGNLRGSGVLPPVSRQLRSSNKNDKQKLEEMLKDFSSDLNNLNNKFGIFAGCITTLLDRVESLESRIIALESWKNDNPSPSSPPPPTTTYASVVGSEVIQGNASGRLERLEYNSSEDDRKNKLMHVQVTHPSLDPSSPSLLPHVQNFLRLQLKMTDREIDANMLVYKSSRPNTVTIKCSDRRFKLFIYCARKKLRSENQSLCENLFINDNLTSFNYSLLKRLKSESKRRIDLHKRSFATVYSYNGKVYVKLCRTDLTENAIHIKYPSCIDSLLRTLDTSED